MESPPHLITGGAKHHATDKHHDDRDQSKSEHECTPQEGERTGHPECTSRTGRRQPASEQIDGINVKEAVRASEWGDYGATPLMRGL